MAPRGIIHQVIVAPAWCPVFRHSAAGASGRGAVAAFAARRLSCPFSMGTPTAKCCRRRLSRLDVCGPQLGGLALRGVGAVAAYAARRLSLFHGLTPTAKCCRRIRGSTGTPGLAPGDDPIYSVAPTQLRRLGQEYSPRRCPGDHLFENRCAHGGWWFWRGSGCRARQLVPGDAAASRWVDQLEDAVRVLANNPFTFQSKVLTKHSSN